MLDSFSLLQIGAYGAMTLLSLTATYRIAGALDCLLMLRRQRVPARHLRAALANQRIERAHDAVEILRQRRSVPAARFFDVLCRRDAAERAPAAKTRLVAEIDRAVLPHRHRLARLAAITGPMGLGFTVLALIVSLVGSTPDNNGVGAGLLQALPVALGTTGIACFTIVALKVSASLLVQRTEETIAVLQDAGTAWLTASRPRPVPPPQSVARIHDMEDV